ncbi:MAG: sensor histidine kinase [Subdoligranulum variabile]|uniref:Sensor histidine kinase n=1 Tax=Subdoligranulum variabile TaxID=214851 RepID=A0A943D8Y9_9FIRM|nr:sensor histidine kinase [Subdoligranulum variabile]
MKTFTRMIRRYVLATAAVVLLVVGLLLGLTVYLGLHVVEQIAQAHGGSVQFMQNAPQGAKAVVTLPTENQAHR